jgi:hypothetical protein
MAARCVVWGTDDAVLYLVLGSMSLREGTTFGSGTIGVGIKPIHPNIKRWKEVAATKACYGLVLSPMSRREDLPAVIALKRPTPAPAFKARTQDSQPTKMLNVRTCNRNAR